MINPKEELRHTLIMAVSPAALNPNVCFDNVEIYVNDRRENDCRE